MNFIMLTPEELKIVDARDQEAKNREADYKEMEDAAVKGDWEEYYRIIDRIKDSLSSVCEHGRSLYSPCLACDELEAKVHDLRGCQDPKYCEICNKECDEDLCNDINCDICHSEKDNK